MAVATPQEYADLESVWVEVYGDWAAGATTQAKGPKGYYLGRVDGAPAFGALVHPYTCRVRGTEVRTAGIAMVGVAGQFRSMRVGTECMSALHGLLAESGYELASLYGFRDAFYRRVGYATCGYRWSLSIDAGKMPALEVGLPVRRVEPSDLLALDPCYNDFTSKLNGSMARSPEMWQTRMGETAPVIYAFGDPVEAYYWCKPDGFFNPLEVGEFVWNSGRGYTSALGHMRAMAVNKSTVEWYEPPTSPYISMFSDQRDTAKRARPTMFRAIGQGPVGLAAAKGWRLSVSSGGYSLGHETGTVLTDSGTLAQILLGEPDPAMLIDLGKVTGESEALNRLSGDFPASDVCCMEFF